MLKIDGTMTVKKILDHHPGMISFFVRHKMLCVGCPAETFHTLEEVARIHGFQPEHLLETIRKFIETERTS